MTIRVILYTKKHLQMKIICGSLTLVEHFHTTCDESHLSELEVNLLHTSTKNHIESN